MAFVETDNITLTKEQYKKLLGMSYKEQRNELANNILNPIIVCGYGFYDHGQPFEKDGKYYIPITSGTSCD